MQRPIDANIEFTQSELNEANCLLLAAIAMGSLKGTSPEGLREGFLQRSGKL